MSPETDPARLRARAERRRTYRREYNKAYRERNRDHLNAVAKAYYYEHREEDREAKSVRSKALYASNPASKLAAGRAWAKAHPEAMRAYNKKCAALHPEVAKAWVAANRDKVRAKSRRHAAAHPEGSRARCAARRARQSGAVGSHTEAQWRAILNDYWNACAYCGSAGPLTRDHVIPLSRGGSDSIDNIAPACGPCNSSKHNRTLDEWVGRAA